MRRLSLILELLALCLLSGAARCWNFRDVFVDGRIFFLDGDCYSRMTRARMVDRGQALVIRHHEFENWPAGTTPHTTAPMDWAIAALGRTVHLGLALTATPALLREQSLDIAGALISPICGVLGCAVLGLWAWRFGLPGWPAAPLVWAISPIVVHGTLLGRPDHQSVQLLLLSLALVAELALLRGLSRCWGILAGSAWAAALWVSLYEPAILFLLVQVFWAVVDRRRFAAAPMHAGWICFGLLCLTALLVEGWRIALPEPSARVLFSHWEQTIGELHHLDPRGPLLYRWLGFVIVLAPVALLAGFFRVPGQERRDRAPLLLLLLLLALFGLTIWQVRWGYFLALVFCLTLPWCFRLLRKVWLAWPVLALSLWPLAQDWDEKLFPEDHPEKHLEQERAVLRLDAIRLREIADAMRSPQREPFLAAWWLSPALAYWSEQPGVAGSSHESLPGTAAAAAFFLAPDATSAERIARDLRVRWVVTDDPDRLLPESRELLGYPASTASSFAAHLHEVGAPRERASAEDLRAAPASAREALLRLADAAEAAQLGSAAFTCTASSHFYKLFRVNDTNLSP